MDAEQPTVCEGRKLRDILRGEGGQTLVEYTLILAAFGIPMIYVARWLLGALAGHYAMVSFLETLPLP
jgi:Flp pilus assembly pilin Flp